MLEELWVPVEGFPNYEVSNYGRVVNVITGRELKPIAHRTGYVRAKLFKNGEYSWFYVHRLVAQAFFVDYDEEYCVELINQIRTDCTVANITLPRKKLRPGREVVHGRSSPSPTQSY